MKKMISVIMAVCLMCMLLACSTSAKPKDEVEAKYPSKPITIIAPAKPGGGYDSLSRAIASMAGNYLGQVIVVENVPGASYTLGTAQACNSNPDGYTLVLCTNKQFSSTPLAMEVEYDPLNGVEYFGCMAEVRWVWGCNAKLFERIGVMDTNGFLEYVKAHPGEIKAGSISIPTALMFQQLAGAGYQFAVTSYEDAASLAVAIANGEVECGFSAASAQNALRESGDIRFLMEIPGVEGAEPLAEGCGTANADFPEIAKILGSTAYQWYILAGPKGMPQETIDAINGFVKAISEDAGFQAMVTKLGMANAYHSAEEVTNGVISEYNATKEYYGQ